MLIIRLQQAMQYLQAVRKTRVSLTEIANMTGIHRKILSRIRNRPASAVKGETIDALVQFFFYELVLLSNEMSPSEELMAKVVRILVSVYPDDVAFWDGIINDRDLPSQKESGPVAGQLRFQAASSVWGNFDKQKPIHKTNCIDRLRVSRENERSKLKTKPTTRRKTSKLRERFG